MLSESNVAVRNLDSDFLVITCSKSNQALFFLLVGVTFCFYLWEHFLVGRAGTLTLVLALLAIRQALATYVRHTVFKDDMIEHCTIFGRKKVAQYSEVGVLERKGEAIIIVAKNFEIILGKKDGFLNAATEILRRKVSNYVTVN